MTEKKKDEKAAATDFRMTPEQVGVLRGAQADVRKAEAEYESAVSTVGAIVRTILAGHGVGKPSEGRLEIDEDAGVLRLTPLEAEE